MTHPVVLAALAVLLVNDHVLKRAFPGAVTGKLSDVAGPVVLAALLGAAARAAAPRLEAAAWWATGAAFVLVKAVPAANAVVPLAGVADPWDALGVIALPLAWRATRRTPPSWRPRAAVRPVAVVLAVLAVSATSQAGEPEVRRVEASGDLVRAYGTDGFDARHEWVSADRGETWVRLPVPSRSPAPYSPPGSGPSTEAPRKPAPTPYRTRACSGSLCYQLTGGDVNESRDGGRTWRLSHAGGRHVLLDVAFVDERTVVVAAGEAGFLRREGDAAWTVPRVRDADADDDGWLGLGGYLLLAALVGVLAVGVLCLCVLAVVDGLTASRRGRSEEADVWSPPRPRTRSSPRRSPRHRR